MEMNNRYLSNMIKIKQHNVTNIYYNRLRYYKFYQSSTRQGEHIEHIEHTTNIS